MTRATDYDEERLSAGTRLDNFVADLIAALLPLLSIGIVAAVPERLGLLIYPEQVAGFILGGAAAVVFLRNNANNRRIEAAGNRALAFAALAVGLWIFIRFPVLSEHGFEHPTECLMIGLLLVVVCLEGLRRAVGKALLIIFVLMMLYAMFGDLIPGVLKGRAQPLGDLLRYLGTDSTATLGQAVQVAAFVVVPFIFFGVLLGRAGGADVFTRLATRLAGSGHGNTAKVAVLASCLFGSISGSAVSNVMSVGIVTIPLMKRSGLKPQVAAAIESVASTGGQLMPPVMGAAAFLMAEYLRVPYSTILVAAIAPALLYYLSVYVQIDFLARRLALPSLAIEELGAGTTKFAVISVIVSFVVLLGGIFLLNLQAEFAAVYASAGLIILLVVFARSNARLNLRGLLDTLQSCGAGIADVVLVTAVAGMIIGLLGTTGLGFAFSIALLELGKTSVPLLLAITALVAVILGMGLPTTGVYLLLATLAAPTLVKLGIDPLSAHMFVFYYGMLSMITPPVAMAAFAAASLAGAGQTATAWEAFRFGWIAYFLPILFIYQPGLLMMGSVFQIALACTSAAVAVPLVTAGLVGHGLFPIGWRARMLAVLLGLAILLPEEAWTGAAKTDVVALIIGIGVIALHVIARRRRISASAQQSAQARAGQAIGNLRV